MKGSISRSAEKGLVLKDYRELSRGADPWDNRAPGIGPRRLEEAFAPLSCLRFSRVLEVGCGRGEFLRRLAPIGRRLVGMDLSARSLAAARRNFPAPGKLRLLRANFLAAPPRGRFDLVCCLRVLPDFGKTVQRSFLEALGRSLKPRGRLLLMVTARPFRLFDPDAFLRRLRRRYALLDLRRLPADPRYAPAGELVILARAKS